MREGWEREREKGWRGREKGGEREREREGRGREKGRRGREKREREGERKGEERERGREREKGGGGREKGGEREREKGGEGERKGERGREKREKGEEREREKGGRGKRERGGEGEREKEGRGREKRGGEGERKGRRWREKRGERGREKRGERGREKREEERKRSARKLEQHAHIFSAQTHIATSALILFFVVCSVTASVAVGKHSACPWYGRVLNVSNFLSQHPGSELANLTFAGKDATAEFDMIHPLDVVEKYAPDAVIGTLGDSREDDDDEEGYIMEEVAKHNKKGDVWVVLNGRVLNVSKFLSQHPDGELAVLTFAGKDATAEFDTIHPLDVVEKYAPDAITGVVGNGKAKKGQEIREVGLASCHR